MMAEQTLTSIVESLTKLGCSDIYCVNIYYFFLDKPLFFTLAIFIS